MIIKNGFTRNPKFDELNALFQEAARKRGIELPLYTNIDLMCDASSGRPLGLPFDCDYMLFWDKDVRYAYQLEALGIRLFNSGRAIALCDDKSLTHIALAGKVPMPRTIIAPLTFPNVGYTSHDFLTRIADELGFPMVVKECYGSFGLQVYLANDMAEAEALLERTTGMPVLFQEFVASSRARDLRVYVVGDHVAASMLRENTTGDFRANVAQGSRVCTHDATPDEARVALTAARELGLDFCGVDLLFGKDGSPILCEVNSNAYFTGLYSCTGVNIAEHIIDHIIECMEAR